MTMDHFGKVMPIHIDVLELIGWDVSMEETKLIKSEAKRIECMRTGHANLVRATRQDYGYDLVKWRDFLMLYDKEFGYCHPYAFDGVDEAVRAAIADPTFARLAALAAEGGREWDRLYYAKLDREREEALAIIAAEDAMITKHTCPFCGKPCPSYRSTCKHCGEAVR